MSSVQLGHVSGILYWFIVLQPYTLVVEGLDVKIVTLNLYLHFYFFLKLKYLTYFKIENIL